jgi:hypothetical protein
MAIGDKLITKNSLKLSTLCCRGHGCQIFLNLIYQNGGKYTKLPLNYQTVIKYTKWP